MVRIRYLTLPVSAFLFSHNVDEDSNMSSYVDCFRY
jgi:hypothetical protein